MRRRILLSMLVIATVATILGIGSWAVFSDTESAGPYTATAGTIDLDMDATHVENGLAVGDLKPSEWQYIGPFLLHNNGLNEGLLDLHFMNVVDDKGIQTDPECYATWGGLDPVTGECVGDWYVPVDDISNWIDVDYIIKAVGAVGEDPPASPELCPQPPDLDPGAVIVGKLGDIESQALDLGTMVPSQWYWLCLSFHLEKDAGNEYQGDKSTFDVEFTLHQPLQPAGRETLRLENKDAAGHVMGDDDIFGSVTYEMNADGALEMQVRVNGLTPDTYHQLALNGSRPDDAPSCDATDDQLASGSEQYPLYDSGFWPGSAPVLDHTTCTTPPNEEGVYNFAYVQTDANGDWSGTVIVANSGESDPANSDNVTAAYPALPVGVYSDVKFVVKEVTGTPMPGTAWTPVLMEMRTMDFTLP
jgi:hypothetical protein